jgi:hypothetical protein
VIENELRLMVKIFPSHNFLKPPWYKFVFRWIDWEMHALYMGAQITHDKLKFNGFKKLLQSRPLMGLINSWMLKNPQSQLRKRAHPLWLMTKYILDLIFFTLLDVYKISQNSIIFSSHKYLCKRYLSLINAYVRDIYHLLMLSRQNNFLTLSLHKKTRFMSYKYLINFSSSKFTISILYFSYIFRAFLSKISFLSFSL